MDIQRDRPDRARSGPGSTLNAGECEATILLVTRAPTAVLATDDHAALPILNAYVVQQMGHTLRYVHTSTVIIELEAHGRVDEPQRMAIQASMRKKKRPLL